MTQTRHPPPPEPGKNQKSPALALSLAFLPSVYLLGLFTIFSIYGMGSSIPPVFLITIGCLVSFFCCLTSMVMLINRARVLAVLLNLLISLFLGFLASSLNALAH